MSRSRRFRYLLYDIVDKQLVDAAGERCGRVDDVVLVGDPPRVTHLVVGMGREHRSRLGRLVHAVAARLYRACGGSLPLEPVQVPWAEVAEWNGTIQLRRRDRDLGLRRLEDQVARVVRRWPGA